MRGSVKMRPVAQPASIAQSRDGRDFRAMSS